MSDLAPKWTILVLNELKINSITQNVLDSKSLRFVPFDANQTHFGPHLTPLM